jgi:hypothetical protein
VLPSSLRLLVGKPIPECRHLIDVRICHRHHVRDRTTEVDKRTAHCLLPLAATVRGRVRSLCRIQFSLII